MDAKTIAAYDAKPAQWAEKYDSLTPKLLHQLACKHFHKGQPTLDIGCGSGRDLRFLNEAGFPAAGLDASQGLLNECQKSFPDYQCIRDSLPLLAGVKSGSFANAYSSAVLMHLDEDDVKAAIENVYRILNEGGVFVFNYRPACGGDEREKDGRLFSNLPPAHIQSVLTATGFRVVFTTEEPEQNTEKVWHYFVAQASSKESKP